MALNDRCLFCRIVSGEIPAKKAYEDDDVVAFHDVNPQAPVHIVLIPKKHAAGLSDFPLSEAQLLSSLLFEASRIAKEKKLDGPGYRLVLNTSVNGGQTVPHLHFHILGGRRMTWPPG